MSMGMLLLPKVAELKQYYINFKKWEGDLNNVKYLDEKKEAKRIERLNAEKNTANSQVK